MQNHEHCESSLGDILSRTGLGKKNCLVNNTSVPNARMLRKPEMSRVRRKVHMKRGEMRTASLSAEIKVLCALREAAVVVLGESACYDALSSA